MIIASEHLEQVLDGLREIFPLLAVSLGFLLAYRYIHDRITRFDDSDEVRRGNAAVALSRGGAYAGVLVAQTGTFILNHTSGYGERLWNHVVNGAVTLVVFTAATFVIDKVVLRKANNNLDLADGNVSVALVELSTFLALGAIMASSFAGDDPGLSFGLGLVNAVVFSFVGLASLMVVYTAYVALWKYRTGVSIDDEIDVHNVAAGIDAGSLLLGFGFVIACSIAGDHVGWGDDFITYGLAVVVALAAITAARVASLVFLPKALRAAGNEWGSTQHHKNVAQSCIVALVTFGFAALTGAAVLT